MQASVIVLGLLSLLLSGCMLASIDKSKSDLSSYEHSNVAKNAALTGERSMMNKMKWILISTNKL